MPRTRRKRKLSEDLNDYFSEQREIIIKTESEDDLPVTGACCVCGTPSGVNLLPLFENGSIQEGPTTVEKMKICIGQEMSPETDPGASICTVCLENLEEHYGFWRQALQCNEYSQNQMTADEAKVMDAPCEIRVCRFCLKISDQLLDLFPEGETSNEHQLEQIRECLAVQMNSWDPVTKICPDCAQRVQRFLDFQAKFASVSVFPKQEQASSSLSSSYGIPSSSAYSEDMGVDINVSDSDYSKEKKKVKLTRVKARTKVTQADIVALLGSDVRGRNFDTVLKNGEQLQVAYEGFEFRLHSINASGVSLWCCTEVDIRRCGVKLEIDPKGIVASITGKVKTHAHPAVPPKLMECPIGKGFVHLKGKNEPFWFFNSHQKGNSHSKSLIFAGYRYYLSHCHNVYPVSIWHCDIRGDAHCMANLEVEGIFQRVQRNGTHSHAIMSQEKIDMVLKACAFDLKSTEAISAFQKDNQVQLVKRKEKKVGIAKQQQLQAIKSVLKEKSPEIFKVLQKDDAERSFKSVNAGAKVKILKDGFEYRYFGTQEDKSTLWKCIMDTLQHCAIIVKICMYGKRLETFKGLRHSHPVEPAAILRYPLGKRMIGDEPLWMLKRFNIYFESRYVIYRDYVYILHESNQKGIARWYCMRKVTCRALLVVKGDFEDVCLRKGHTHEKTAQDILTRLIEGRSHLLNSDENLTFKQKLMSFPSMAGKIWDEVRNEHETFYILNEVKTGKRIGYGFIFRGYRYTFVSLDQYGTSRWTCLKSDECRLIAMVHGIYESIYINEDHTHRMLLDSEIKLMIQRSTNSVRGAVEGSVLIERSASEPKHILSILARQDPERNFSVKRVKAKLLIIFKNEEFRRALRDGTSSWICVWHLLRKCPVVIHLSDDGKKATIVDPNMKHNHSRKEVPIFYLKGGKGSIYDERRGEKQSYWLYNYQTEFRKNRAIIYQGYNFSLHTIGNQKQSSWKCRVWNCTALVRVADCLKSIIHKNKHIHEPLSSDEICTITGLTEVDKDLLPVNSEPIYDPTINRELRSSTFEILSKNDSDRNFQVSIHKEKVKILQDGYEYYYHFSNQTHSFWKCIYSFLRRCRAVLHVDNHCKEGVLPELSKHSKHNHPIELWSVFKHPLGKHSIKDSNTKTMKPVWYLMQPDFLRPYPILIYNQNKYRLTFLTANGDTTKWRCAGRKCMETITVTGNLKAIVGSTSLHKHEPPSKEKIATWIRCFGSAADK